MKTNQNGFVLILIILLVLLVGAVGYFVYVTNSESSKSIVQEKTDPTTSTQIAPSFVPPHSTVVNESRDVHGWYSGEHKYIDLGWDVYNFNFFRLYRKTIKDNQWQPLTPSPFKNEKGAYFDNNLDNFETVSYKLEAVTEGGEVLKTYIPLTFDLE